MKPALKLKTPISLELILQQLNKLDHEDEIAEDLSTALEALVLPDEKSG